MPDMDRLFELLDEAMHAVDCNCTTTTTAYVKMARTEWFHMLRDAGDREEEEGFSKAVLFIDGLVTRQLWNGKAASAARNAFDFWSGFDDGLNSRTQSRKASPAFRRGYRFGKDGI